MPLPPMGLFRPQLHLSRCPRPANAVPSLWEGTARADGAAAARKGRRFAGRGQARAPGYALAVRWKNFMAKSAPTINTMAIGRAINALGTKPATR